MDKIDEKMQKANDILSKVFGYEHFRGNQEAIIQSVLTKTDTLAVMSTGGGKSLCYQIPALIFSGVTLVISPLISLMLDQVSNLCQHGISAVFLNSTITSFEYNQNIKALSTGKAKIAYLSPEGLNSKRFDNLANTINVSLLAVDEAHCVSTWGDNFRPDYLCIATFRQKFPDAVCLALTATATSRVQLDIINKLKMLKPQKFVSSFNRKNIYLSVKRKHGSGYYQIVDFLDEHIGESGIIYCFSRKEVDELTTELKRLGFSAASYHAGLDSATKQKNQEDFLQGQISIIIATIAFGMGINKSNVRFVIHHSISKSLEQYYQEIGRAGRDGKDSIALLLFSNDDKEKLIRLCNITKDKKANELLSPMIEYTTIRTCFRQYILNYFGENYTPTQFSKCCCDNCKRGSAF